MSYRDACIELLIAEYLPDGERDETAPLPSNAEYARRFSPQFATNQLLTAILLELRQLRRDINMLEKPEAPESEEVEIKPDPDATLPDGQEPTLPDQAAPTTPAPPPEPEPEPEPDVPPKEV